MSSKNELIHPIFPCLSPSDSIQNMMLKETTNQPFHTSPNKPNVNNLRPSRLTGKNIGNVDLVNDKISTYSSKSKISLANIKDKFSFKNRKVFLRRNALVRGGKATRNLNNECVKDQDISLDDLGPRKASGSTNTAISSSVPLLGFLKKKFLSSKASKRVYIQISAKVS